MHKHRAWLVASAVLFISAAGCGSPGTVETHRIKGSETPPPPDSGAEADGGGDDGGDSALGPCPSGFTCMDIAALGFMATDPDGKPVTASCSSGGPTSCDEADPAGSCKGLSQPFCAHLKLGTMDIVSCAQRCTP